jgi:O-antigen/teichoic acid export membrane protein
VVITPILTRVYTPENFGIFAFFISITVILSVIVAGRYELAIMLPDEKGEESINLLILSILIACGVSLMILVIVFILNNQITKLLSNREISKWLYFIALAILLTGTYQALSC